MPFAVDWALAQRATDSSGFSGWATDSDWDGHLSHPRIGEAKASRVLRKRRSEPAKAAGILGRPPVLEPRLRDRGHARGAGLRIRGSGAEPDLRRTYGSEPRLRARHAEMRHAPRRRAFGSTPTNGERSRTSTSTAFWPRSGERRMRRGGYES